MKETPMMAKFIMKPKAYPSGKFGVQSILIVCKPRIANRYWIKVRKAYAHPHEKEFYAFPFVKAGVYCYTRNLLKWKDHSFIFENNVRNSDPDY